MMPVNGNTALVRGEIVRVKLQGMDLISLDVQAQFLESIEKPMGTPLASAGSGSPSPNALHGDASQLSLNDPSALSDDDLDDIEEAFAAGPLEISVEVESSAQPESQPEAQAQEPLQSLGNPDGPNTISAQSDASLAPQRDQLSSEET